MEAIVMQKLYTTLRLNFYFVVCFMHLIIARKEFQDKLGWINRMYVD